MKIHKRKLVSRECESKWRKMDSLVVELASPNSSSTTNCNELVCWPWLRSLWRRLRHLSNSKIPKDVPKGHMVVYVGQSLKRYVIKISLLKHPLFRALLDEARDEYGFTTTSKLCIPCDENIFLNAICSANSPQERRIHFCLSRTGLN